MRNDFYEIRRMYWRNLSFFVKGNDKSISFIQGVYKSFHPSKRTISRLYLECRNSQKELLKKLKELLFFRDLSQLRKKKRREKSLFLPLPHIREWVQSLNLSWNLLCSSKVSLEVSCLDIKSKEMNTEYHSIALRSDYDENFVSYNSCKRNELKVQFE